MGKERYLVVKGLAGFGDRLLTLARAVQLAAATRRTLVIDWSDASWNHDTVVPKGFWHYCDLVGLPESLNIVRGDAETWTLLDSLSSEGVATLPAEFKGACRRVDYLLRGGRLCLGDVPIQLTEQEIVTAREPVVMYLAYCSGQVEPLLPHLRLRAPTQPPRAAIGVHFRNTDKANSLADTLARVERAWRPGRKVWLATDDAAAVTAFRTRFGPDLEGLTPPPRPVSGGGIHHATAAELAAVGTTKERLLFDMMCDVVALRDCVLFVDSPNSLFSRIVHGLRAVVRSSLRQQTSD